MPSLFEQINARADAIKAAKWVAYTPLTKRQLNDNPRKTDTDLNTETVTLDVGVFGQFVVLRRPTEREAFHRDKHDNLMVLRHVTVETRRCIWCKCHLRPHEFVHSARYLHHISYACKPCLQAAKRKPWQHLSAVA